MEACPVLLPLSFLSAGGLVPFSFTRGCLSQGKTKEEAAENIKEAIRGYVAALHEDGLPVAKERFDVLVVAA
jgi:predicted RNase H-like HicB family nuclease